MKNGEITLTFSGHSMIQPGSFIGVKIASARGDRYVVKGVVHNIPGQTVVVARRWTWWDSVKVWFRRLWRRIF